MTFKKWSENRHKKKLEIIRAEGKQSHHFYPIVDLRVFAVMMVLAVIAYGFFVAPCSFEAQGSIDGKLVMQSPLVSNDTMTVNHFEGKISGTGPCVAALSLGFNLKGTNTPPSTPIKVVPRSSLSPSGGI